MRNADRSARKEQIPDIARIQTAVRNPVASFNVHIRIGRKRRAVQTFGNMQIDIPAAIGDNVLKCRMRDEILLAQNIIARKPAAFALCGEGRDPIERVILGLMPFRIFDVIPHPEQHF